MTTAAPPQPAAQYKLLPGVFKPGEGVQSRGICIYGRSGSGKTTLLGTMPGRGLVLDVPQLEGGTEVLADKRDRIDVRAVTSWDELDGIYWYLAKEKHPYQWVAFDTITAQEKLARRKVVAERELAADPHIVTMQEWGKTGMLVSELIYRSRLLPIHTLWVAQERTHELDADTKLIGPDLIRSSLSALLPSMLLVAHLSVVHTLDGKYEWQLKVGPRPGYFTKCRARPGVEVPMTVRNPSIGGLLRYLQGKEATLDVVDESVPMIQLS